MTRHIPLQGVENFRDFGDYAAGQGRLKKGVLFRAAHQAEATDQDLAAMAALGIVTIVDLRRPNERERDPSRRWEGFAAEVIDNDMGVTGEDPWHAFLRGSDLSVGSIRDYLVEYYRRAPFKDRHLDLFRRYFQAVAQARGPVLIHCAAGKDRTGLLAALTHHVAGVSDDDVIDDYLLTNNEERFARRGPKFAAIIETATGRRPSDAAMRAAMGVEADYLATAIAEMKVSTARSTAIWSGRSGWTRPVARRCGRISWLEGRPALTPQITAVIPGLVPGTPLSAAGAGVWRAGAPLLFTVS